MDSKIKNNIKMSLEAKRLLQKQLLILPIISNSIQKVGVKNYRKNDHWAWYVFPTTKIGSSDPAKTALCNETDARLLLKHTEPRKMWILVLDLLTSACYIQKTRNVLPNIDHKRVELFIKEWTQPDGIFVRAASAHTKFNKVLLRFAQVWKSLIN